MTTLRPVLRALSFAGVFGAVAALLLQARVDRGAGHNGLPDVDGLAALFGEGFRWAAVAFAVLSAAVSVGAAAAEALASRSAARGGRTCAAPRARTLLRLLLGPGCALLLSPAGAAWAVPADATERPPPVLVPVDPTPTAGLDPATATIPPAAVAAEADVGDAAAPEQTDRRFHVVRPGEHFWSIARDAVAADLGRAPTEAEVTPRWLAIIEANRSRLADPTNPDLLFPGQELDIAARPSVNR